MHTLTKWFEVISAKTKSEPSRLSWACLLQILAPAGRVHFASRLSTLCCSCVLSSQHCSLSRSRKQKSQNIKLGAFKSNSSLRMNWGKRNYRKERMTSSSDTDRVSRRRLSIRNLPSPCSTDSLKSFFRLVLSQGLTALSTKCEMSIKNDTSRIY